MKGFRTRSGEGTLGTTKQTPVLPTICWTRTTTLKVQKRLGYISRYQSWKMQERNRKIYIRHISDCCQLLNDTRARVRVRSQRPIS